MSIMDICLRAEPILIVGQKIYKERYSDYEHIAKKYIVNSLLMKTYKIYMSRSYQYKDLYSWGIPIGYVCGRLTQVTRNLWIYLRITRRQTHIKKARFKSFRSKSDSLELSFSHMQTIINDIKTLSLDSLVSMSRASQR